MFFLVYITENKDNHSKLSLFLLKTVKVQIKIKLQAYKFTEK